MVYDNVLSVVDFEKFISWWKKSINLAGLKIKFIVKSFKFTQITCYYIICIAYVLGIVVQKDIPN